MTCLFIQTSSKLNDRASLVATANHCWQLVQPLFAGVYKTNGKLRIATFFRRQ